MKKFLLVSILTLGIGTVLSANMGNSKYRQEHMKSTSTGHMNSFKKKGYSCNGNRHFGKLNNEQREEFRKRLESNQVLIQGKIKLQENKVAMMKENAKETLDFKKIGEINKNTAIVRAEMKTERMRIQHEVEKTVK